jgi:hypothetical protein
MYGTKCQVNFGMGNDKFHEETIPRMREAFACFCEPLVAEPEIIYTNRRIDKYKDKVLLVLGGGGSTNKYLENYIFNGDYIWSMNSFYKNPIIYKDIHVDLFTVGPEVDLKDPLLLEYLYKWDTTAAFELHQKWARNFPNPDTGLPVEYYWEEAEKFYYDKNKICFQTKFYSQLGAGVRLLIFAGICKFSRVYFIGFDGPEAILRGDHAFEVGKKQFPRAVQGMNSFNKIKFFEESYKIFWKYIRNLYPDTQFISIDKENKYHK